MRVVAYYSRSNNLEALRQEVNLRYRVAAEIVEQRERRLRQWPQLQVACQQATRLKAKLVIAPIGRLTWNLAFLHVLDAFVVQGGVFDCLDNDLMDEGTLPMQLALAQNRSQQLANKMRDRMAILKKTTKFGFAASNHRNSPACVAGAALGARKAANLRRLRAETTYRPLIARVEALLMNHTWDQTVEIVNQEGFRTVANRLFNRPTLIRIMQRT